LSYSFTERWLLYAGVPENDVRAKNLIALERAKRFPKPHRWIYFLTIWFIEWLSPLLFLFRPTKSGKLNNVLFSILIKKLKENRWRLVRMSAFFAFVPLIETLFDEDIDKTKYPEHPLKLLLRDQKFENKDTFDFIIIGTGAGGAPIADQLTKNGYTVAIVEKGGLIDPKPAPQMIEKYYVGQGLTMSMTGGMALVLAGSTIGGTTAINSGTCLRPLNSCLKIWDQDLGTDFSSGTLDPYIEKIELQTSVCVPPKTIQSKSAELFVKGLNKLGFTQSYILPRNIGNCKGSGRCCFGCPMGIKQSTDYAFLPSALKNGAKLFANTQATKILENKMGIKVELQDSNGVKSIMANKLIISCGALYTPDLIRRNKLGSQFKHVGKNMKIHPATKVFAYFPDHYHGPHGIPQGIGFRPSKIPRITLEGIHTPKSMVGQILSAGGDAFNWWMERIDYLSSFGLMIQDRGTGSVREVNSFPWINYKLHPSDVTDIQSGLILIAEAFFAAGAEKVLLPFSGEQKKEFSSVEEMKKFDWNSIKGENLMISGFHPMGTAGMGKIVDVNQKLIGSDRIYISDASVLPNSPGVNPQITIMALSLRLANHLTKKEPHVIN